MSKGVSDYINNAPTQVFRSKKSNAVSAPTKMEINSDLNDVAESMARIHIWNIPQLAPQALVSETTKKEESNTQTIAVEIVDVIRANVVNSFNPTHVNKAIQDKEYNFDHTPTDIYAQITGRLERGLCPMKILIRGSGRDLHSRAGEDFLFHDVGFEFQHEGTSPISTVVCFSRFVLGSVYESSKYTDKNTNRGKVRIKLGIPIVVHNMMTSVLASVGYSNDGVEVCNHFAWYRAVPFGVDTTYRISAKSTSSVVNSFRSKS